MLTGCPGPILEWVFGFLSLGQALLHPSRVRRALEWSTGQGLAGGRRWALALALLVNRGRFLALASVPSRPDPETLQKRMTIQGIERLQADARNRGAMLLRFHLGPPGPSLAMGLAAYTRTTGQASGHATTDEGGPRTVSFPATRPRRIGRPEGDPVPRAVALYRVRARLLAGETVGLLGDGRWGRKLFAVETPGGAQLVIRGGWWFLRRETGALVYPVLSHREGRRLVAVVHPPLPPVALDAQEDLLACRRALAALMADYVRRFPEQCVALAFRAPER